MPTTGAGAAKNVRVMTNALVASTEEAAAKVGVLIVNEVKKLLSQPHGGPSYPAAPGRPGGNPSSLPGEPPALQTGWLRSSYSSWKEGPGIVAIGSRGSPSSGENYAGFLEFGTSKMAARPHLRPAVEKVKEMVPSTVAKEITTAQEAARGGLV